MPLRIPGQATVPAPDASIPSTRRGGLRIPDENIDTSAAPVEPESGGGSWLPAILGGAAMAGGAMLARNPRAPAMIRNGLETANAIRQQAMLSGFAPFKSILGNIGAVGAEAAESRSLAPFKSFLSMDTVRDAVNTFKSNPKMTTGVTLSGKLAPLGLPGRVMQSLDVATQNALVRGGTMHDPVQVAKWVSKGMSTADATQKSASKAAEAAVMQAPLPKQLADALDNPVMRFAIPFRRTPFNQFIEGGKTMGSARDLPVLAGYGAAGTAHGAATADDQYPVSVPFGIAASAKYGLPYALAALVGRNLAGGRGFGGIPSGALPVSEYGVGESLSNPAGPITEPAALRALRTLSGR